MRALVILAVASLALGSCSSDDGDAVDDGTPSAELAAVLADAQRLAPALESAVRSGPYPTTLAEAEAALVDAGLAPSEGNVVGGYRYDPETVEFVLCLEGPTGAFAAYDTRPMSLLETGETGGCP